MNIYIYIYFNWKLELFFFSQKGKIEGAWMKWNEREERKRQYKQRENQEKSW